MVIASRVPNGRALPNYGFEGGGKTLVEAGAVAGDDLSPQKARILLILLLQNGVAGQKNLQDAFDRQNVRARFSAREVFQDYGFNSAGQLA